MLDSTVVFEIHRSVESKDCSIISTVFCKDVCSSSVVILRLLTKLDIETLLP